MFDYNDLVIAMKQSCKDMLNTMQLSTFEYGTVISSSPLKIQLEQKKTLTKAQLVLTRNVTDFETEVTVDWKTEETENTSAVTGSMGEFEKHLHGVRGRKKILIHNALQVGEKVVLIKQQGGQSYLVVDRVVNT